MANGKVDISSEEIKEQIKIWQLFVDSPVNNGEIILNPDKKKVESLARGVLHNQKVKGMKFCPCRLTTGDRTKDLKLVCPCNFKIQKTWLEKKECWCGLFMEKK